MKAIVEEEEHVRAKFGVLTKENAKLENALTQALMQAKGAGVNQDALDLISETAGRTLGHMEGFASLVTHKSATSVHRCQTACLWLAGALVALVLIFITVEWGNAGTLCLPWFLGGDPHLCLKYEMNRCKHGCAPDLQTAASPPASACASDDDEELGFGPSILYVWNTVEKREERVPDNVMCMNFLATTTLAFCKHVKTSPHMLGHDWSAQRSCSDCSKASLRATLECLGLS